MVINNLFKNLKYEKGQSLVEYAMVVPILFFAIFAIIEICWIGYQTMSFDYSYRQATWNVAVSDPNPIVTRLIEGQEAANLIENNMMLNSLGINNDSLVISDASIYIWSDKVTQQYPGSSVGEYETNSAYWRYMRIKAKIYYKIPALTPAGEMIFGHFLEKTREIDKKKLISITDI
ncbi:MAG: pilus assembly protein [Fusobacteria bacterium]|nr:pilus assembly protein [Fusobacteriota bacterium]